MLRSLYIDQWRGISVALVVIGHVIRFRYEAQIDAGRIGYYANMWSALGGMVGVCVFFVISGFLITKLMLREEERTGTISLRSFYIRRSFRIFPAMLLFLAVSTALGAAGLFTMTPVATLQALSFACNTPILECASPYGHFWSLAVEEQFYLFWPVLLLVTRGRGRVVIVTAALVASTIAAPIQSLLVHGWVNNGLAMSCLSSGALFALSPKFRECFRVFARIPTVLFAVVLCGLVPFVMTRWVGSQPVLLVVLPVLVVALVLGRDGSVVKSALVGRGLKNLGLVSYSLYLWHSLAALHPGEYASPDSLWMWLAIPAAWVSYRYVELPFIAMGQVIERRTRGVALGVPAA